MAPIASPAQSLQVMIMKSFAPIFPLQERIDIIQIMRNHRQVCTVADSPDVEKKKESDYFLCMSPPRKYTKL